jgi:hypothetical protein
MNDELIISPYDRRHAGARNQFVIRRHEWLAEQAAKAIMRRSHPAWSQFACGFEVAA